MKIFTWVAQVLLILGFIAFGIPKLFVPIQDLIVFGMIWMEDFVTWQIRVIGFLETLGVLGLTLPYFIKALPKILIPIASAGLGLTMIGAIITHIERQDPILSIIITSFIFLLCVIVTFKRYQEVQR